MPDTCRIWLYQSSCSLTEDQVNYIESEGRKFCDTWTSHQQPMSAEVKVFYGAVLMIILDESKATASGCGIDKSVGFVRAMEQYCGNDFFDRMRMVFPSEGSDGILILSVKDLPAYLDKSIITPDSMVVNAIVQNLGEFRRDGIIPFNESWSGKMMVKEGE